MRVSLVPLYLVITVGPFAKWGINFMTCNPHSTGGHVYIIIYLHTSTFKSELTKDARRHIHHQSQPYRIIKNTLYRIGVDSILHWCLTLEEAEKFLNDYHSGTCGGHMSSYATT